MKAIRYRIRYKLPRPLQALADAWQPTTAQERRALAWLTLAAVATVAAAAALAAYH